MLFQSKTAMIFTVGLFALLFSGCYTSFSTLHSAPAIKTVYVVEEFEEEPVEIYVYDAWYEYVPVYRPRWVYYTYRDPIVNVCLYSPGWAWYAHYDPWDVHFCSAGWSVSWSHYYGWTGYPPVFWHRPAVHYAHGVGYHGHKKGSHHYHSDPVNFARRPFDHRDSIRRSDRSGTRVASHASTSRTASTSHRENTPATSRLAKSGRSGRITMGENRTVATAKKRSENSVRVINTRNQTDNQPAAVRRSSVSRSALLSASAVSAKTRNATARSSRASDLKKSGSVQTRTRVSRKNTTSGSPGITQPRSSTSFQSTKTRVSRTSTRSKSLKKSVSSSRKTVRTAPVRSTTSKKPSISSSSRRSTTSSAKRTSESVRSVARSKKRSAPLKTSSRRASVKTSRSKKESNQRKRR